MRLLLGASVLGSLNTKKAITTTEIVILAFIRPQARKWFISKTSQLGQWRTEEAEPFRGPNGGSRRYK